MAPWGPEDGSCFDGVSLGNTLPPGVPEEVRPQVLATGIETSVSAHEGLPRIGRRLDGFAGCLGFTRRRAKKNPLILVSKAGIFGN